MKPDPKALEHPILNDEDPEPATTSEPYIKYDSSARRKASEKSPNFFHFHREFSSRNPSRQKNPRTVSNPDTLLLRWDSMAHNYDTWDLQWYHLNNKLNSKILCSLWEDMSYSQYYNLDLVVKYSAKSLLTISISITIGLILSVLYFLIPYWVSSSEFNDGLITYNVWECYLLLSGALIAVAIVFWVFFSEKISAGKRLELRRSELVDIIFSWNKMMFNHMGLTLGISDKGGWLWIEKINCNDFRESGSGLELCELNNSNPAEQVKKLDQGIGWGADHEEYVYGNCGPLKEPRMQELSEDTL